MCNYEYDAHRTAGTGRDEELDKDVDPDRGGGCSDGLPDRLRHHLDGSDRPQRIEEDRASGRPSVLALRRERYVLGRNDCSNKAGRYARLLIEEMDCEAAVIVVKTPKGTHAVTRVSRNGETLYADPTSGRWSASLEDWGSAMYEVTRRDLYANREYL
jgi:hypothetical protein